MKRFLLSIAVAAIVLFASAPMLMLGGCAAVQSANQQIAQDVHDIVAPIKQATLEDAQAALAIANANGDTDAAPCYQDIVDELSKPGSTGVPAINGLLSTLEAARTFKAPTVPPKLHKDCAVLVIDAQQTAFKLGLRLAPVGGALKVQQGAAALGREAAALQAAHP